MSKIRRFSARRLFAGLLILACVFSLSGKDARIHAGGKGLSLRGLSYFVNEKGAAFADRPLLCSLDDVLALYEGRWEGESTLTAKGVFISKYSISQTLAKKLNGSLEGTAEIKKGDSPALGCKLVIRKENNALLQLVFEKKSGRLLSKYKAYLIDGELFWAPYALVLNYDETAEIFSFKNGSLQINSTRVSLVKNSRREEFYATSESIIVRQTNFDHPRKPLGIEPETPIQTEGAKQKTIPGIIDAFDYY